MNWKVFEVSTPCWDQFVLSVKENQRQFINKFQRCWFLRSQFSSLSLRSQFLRHPDVWQSPSYCAKISAATHSLSVLLYAGPNTLSWMIFNLTRYLHILPLFKNMCPKAIHPTPCLCRVWQMYYMFYTSKSPLHA